MTKKNDNIVYSIPVKVGSTKSAYRVTIPKPISKKMELKKDDELIWIYYEDGTIEIKKESD